ncbi:MAG: TonB C-terminal domain-containing protein [Deltaproteobacteria bacterium]|nr:TonB C-terminal domain-containing protein [Deltaproteobacteria bacterium]
MSQGSGVVGVSIGFIVTVVMHGALGAGYAIYAAADHSSTQRRLDAEVQKKQPPLLCSGRRCGRLEGRQKRRAPEPPPLVEPEILEASMVPALGGVLPDPKRLPEIETVERPEIFEDAVNLDQSNSELAKIIKGPEHQEAKLDPARKDTLDKLLDDQPLDPRARAKDLSRLTGFKEGEIGGQGMEVKLGSIYSNQASKAIRKEFKLSPFFDDATLKKLSVKILVKKMRLDGSIEEFEIKKKSGDRGFDDAAVAAIKQFVSKEGGTKTLPTPDPEVLRYINQKGLLIQFDGRVIRLQ